LINQADVALLQYPLGLTMPEDVAVNDLNYWQNHTNPNGYFTGDRYSSKACFYLSLTSFGQTVLTVSLG